MLRLPGRLSLCVLRERVSPRGKHRDAVMTAGSLSFLMKVQTVYTAAGVVGEAALSGGSRVRRCTGRQGT